jgi:hypothetical protein
VTAVPYRIGKAVRIADRLRHDDSVDHELSAATAVE